jgi:DNA polymerase III alpha subunit
MKTTPYSELVFDEDDLCDLIMQGHNLLELEHVVLDPEFAISKIVSVIDDVDALKTWTQPVNSTISLAEFDANKQQQWFMPDEYKTLDIAQYVLSLCNSDEELQRCGHELLMFQERNMFDLLRYLKYLVNTMTNHQVIWGVGRGSSVASYVLYKLNVHRIDSLYYELDPTEFLR